MEIASQVVGRRMATGGLVVGLAVMAACAVPPAKQPGAAPLVTPRDVAVSVAGRVTRVPLEDYVAATVVSEVAPVGDAPAVAQRIFELQAIVARTYAVRSIGRHARDGFDLCDTTHCQLYQPARLRTSRFAAQVRDAVRRTAGRVVVFGSTVAETVFHADCGGMTTSAREVWGRPVPYLVGTHDDVAETAHRDWTLEVNVDRLRAALNGDNATAVGRRIDAIEVIERDASGRAVNVRVRGDQTVTLRGDRFRAMVNRVAPAPGLQSTLFLMQRRGQTLTFSGSGYGHGVGLCQRGAMARLRAGASLDEVLTTYFAGTRIATLR